MALIKTFRVVPPRGWRYVQPETGVRFHEQSFDKLVAAVKAHREYKQISIEGIEEDIQRQLCIGLSTEQCKPETGEDYRPVKDLTHSLTTSKVIGLSKAITKFVATGGKFVSKEEAERRAAICRGCPFNKPAQLCSCSKAYGLIEALIPKDRKEIGVSVCSACGCSLQAKVNLPMDVIAASLQPGTVLPPWCWQREAQSPGTPL